MKKLVIVLFVLIIMCPSMSFAQKINQIYFDRPQGWELQQIDKPYGTMINLISPSRNYLIQFVLKEIPNHLRSKTVDELNDIDESTIKLKAVKHSSAKIEIAGTTGIGAWLSYKNQKNNKYMNHYVIQLKHKSTFLTINCIAGEDQKNAALSYFEKYKPETSAILMSVRFLE